MDENARIRQEVWREVERLSDEEINREIVPGSLETSTNPGALVFTEVTVARQMKKAAERADQPIPGEKPIRLLLDRSLPAKVPIPAL